MDNQLGYSCRTTGISAKYRSVRVFTCPVLPCICPAKFQKFLPGHIAFHIFSFYSIMGFYAFCHIIRHTATVCIIIRRYLYNAPCLCCITHQFFVFFGYIIMDKHNICRCLTDCIAQFFRCIITAQHCRPYSFCCQEQNIMGRYSLDKYGNSVTLLKSCCLQCPCGCVHLLPQPFIIELITIIFKYISVLIRILHSQKCLYCHLRYFHIFEWLRIIV